MFPRRTIPALLAALALFAASPAHAQGTARSLDIDVSIRASGMGEASNAVFWGNELNQWSNPALLGYARGIRYEWGKTQLVPGLANNVFFESNVLKLGAGGLGVFFSGKPSGLGSVKLDYGLSQGADQNGNPTGTFRSWEKIESWGFGLSLARSLQALARVAGHELPPISRWGDVSLGMNSKDVSIVLAPGVGGGASTTAHDRGLLVRVSPLEALGVTRNLPLGVDLAYGWSELSYDQPSLVFININNPDPVSQHHRRGYAGRLSFDAPSGLRRAARHRRLGWLLEGFEPLLSAGYANDRARIEPSNGQFNTHGWGYELAVANVFAYRFGRYEDPLGQIDGRTRGWSAGLPIGRLAGARYEHGTIPQARNSGLRDVQRDAVYGWIDPLAIWQLSREGRPREVEAALVR